MFRVPVSLKNVNGEFNWGQQFSARMSYLHEPAALYFELNLQMHRQWGKDACLDCLHSSVHYAREGSFMAVNRPGNCPERSRNCP